MKRVHPNKKGSSGMTMTVAEMIDELKKYDPEIPVLATLEGIFAGIRSENFLIEDYEGRKQITIDVEDYG